MIPAQRPGETVAEQEALDVWAVVQRAQQGDQQAFADLYARYQPAIFWFIYSRTKGNQTLADDLAADTWVKAIKNIGAFTWQGRDFGAWLITIARNLTLDYYKSYRWRHELLAGDFTNAQDAEDLDPLVDPQMLADAQFVKTVLGRLIEKLLPEQRRVVELRFMAGLSVTETAAAMGKREGAVKSLQYRAVAALARALPAGVDERGLPPAHVRERAKR